MAIMLRRQLSDGEKETILQRFGRKCFANGHVIPDDDVVHFDHIKAFASGGPTDLDNIAPMCEVHNKAKGTLALEDFRVRLRLREFFAEGDSLTLKNLLVHLKTKGDIPNYGEPVVVHENGKMVSIDSGNTHYEHTVYTCPTTGWKFSTRHSPSACLTAMTTMMARWAYSLGF